MQVTIPSERPDETARVAVWQYREAYHAVAAITGHLASYPDRVDSID